MQGRFAMGRVMDVPVDQDVLTWDGGIGPVGALSLEAFSVERRAFVNDTRDERRVWITCRWLSLSGQLTTRGSAAIVFVFQAMPVAGSPHRRPRSLSCRGQGEACLNFVRSREQGALVVEGLTFEYASAAESGLAFVAEGLKHLMNSSRGKVPARERVLW